MASACRSAAILHRRAVNARPIAIASIQTLIPQSILAPAAPSSIDSFPLPTSRFAYVMRSLETMLPLHTAIASTRLKSNIAMDTTCWSWLSLDFAVPR